MNAGHSHLRRAHGWLGSKACRPEWSARPHCGCLRPSLGPESPLPPFTGLQRIPDPSASANLPPDMRERIAYGRLANPLPYALQNGYSRDLRAQDVPRSG